MLYHEIFSLFESLDILLTEGFKDDMYRLYPEAKDNGEFNNAIKIFNSNQKIKEAIKKKISINGNIADSLKTTCPTAQDFINFINNLLKEISTKEQEQQEYKQLKQGTASAGETDYWMIPCHTFDELHAAAFKYTGNLPRLSKEEISKKYGIDTPKPATFYSTDQTPAEFLEYMKNEDKFFMAPTWCIAGSEKGRDYFDRYKLETSKDEKALCYVFISKKYPNVRFCVTLKKENQEKEVDIRNEKIKFTDMIDLNEVRDSWQIGGEDTVRTGAEMMELAFGLKIRKVIDNIFGFIITKTVRFSELKNGSRLFCESTDIPFISGSFDSLVHGGEMFLYSNIEKVNAKFPVLEEAGNMFYDCISLTEFTSDLPKLINGSFMFTRCDELKKFECNDLSKLKNGSCMFIDCISLMSFSNDLPSLVDGTYMFSRCESLTSFKGDLSSLETGTYMFGDCKNLTRFDSDLSSLIDGERMFEGCKLDTESVKNIAETISNAPDANSPITIGVDEMDEEKEKYIAIIKEKGWKVEIK